MHIKCYGTLKKFQGRSLGVIYLFITAILAVKNNVRISFWEVYIAGKNPNPKAAHILKFLLSSQVSCVRVLLCRHVRN